MIIGLWGDSFFDSGCGYWAREKNQKVINDSTAWIVVMES